MDITQDALYLYEKNETLGNSEGHIQTPLSRLHLANRGFESGTSWLWFAYSTTELYPRPYICMPLALWPSL